MVTLRIKKNLVALNKKNCEEHPRSNFAENSDHPRPQQDFITQVAKEIEGRVTDKLSQEFSRTENLILDALSRLHDFLLNPLIQGHSGTAPETSLNASRTNQGTNEDDSQSDRHPEASIFQSQMTRNSGPEEPHDMVTGVHKEVTYCYSTTSSGKQKNRSNSRPEFRSENTPVTIFFGPPLLGNWQTTTIRKLSKQNQQVSNLPKSPTTTMPTFDEKSEKFQLFEDFSKRILKSTAS